MTDHPDPYDPIEDITMTVAEVQANLDFWHTNREQLTSEVEKLEAEIENLKTALVAKTAELVAFDKRWQPYRRLLKDKGFIAADDGPTDPQ